MAILAPPPPAPRVGYSDDGGLKRLRFRLMQILVTGITIVATAWVCTFGAIPAILALMVAKHILVAVLVMGMGVDAQRPNEYGL